MYDAEHQEQIGEDGAEPAELHGMNPSLVDQVRLNLINFHSKLLHIVLSCRGLESHETFQEEVAQQASLG